MTTYAAPRTNTGRGVGAAIWSLIFGLVVGAVYVVLSLPGSTAKLSVRGGWTCLSLPAHWSTDISHALPNFADIQRLILYALLTYGGALLILSLRHGRIGLFGMGIVTLAVATSILHLLAWVGFIAFYVGSFVIWIANVVLGFLGGIARNIGMFIYEHVLTLMQPLLGSLSWVGVSGAILLVLLLTYKFGTGFIKAVAAIIGIIIGVMAGIFVLALVLKFVLPVLVYIVIGGAVLVGLMTLGQLFIDQMKSTMLAGSGPLGVVMGAIAIGSTIALLLLMGNVYGVYSLYPTGFSHFADQWIRSRSTPTFDAMVTFCVTALCAVGIVRNFVRMRPEPDVAEFGKSLIYTILGMIFGGALAAIGSQTGN